MGLVVMGLLLGLAVPPALGQGAVGRAPSPAPSASGQPVVVASGAPVTPRASGTPLLSPGATAAPASGAASPLPQATTSPRAGADENSTIVLPPAGDADATGAGTSQLHWGRQIAVTTIWLIVICGGAWFVLRLFYSSGPGLGGFGRRNRKMIHVLDRQVVGPQKALILVEVPGKVVLVGITEQQIRTLAELNPDDLLEGDESVESASVSPPREVARPIEEADGVEEQRLADLFGRRSNDSPTSLGRP